MSELVCAANQLTGFCIIGVFTETFGTDIKPIQAFSELLMDTAGQKALAPSIRKISHTYLTMVKRGTVTPYLKKIQKIYESLDLPFEFC